MNISHGTLMDIYGMAKKSKKICEKKKKYLAIR